MKKKKEIRGLINKSIWDLGDSIASHCWYLGKEEYEKSPALGTCRFHIKVIQKYLRAIDLFERLRDDYK